MPMMVMMPINNQYEMVMTPMTMTIWYDMVATNQSNKGDDGDADDGDADNHVDSSQPIKQ